VAPSGQLLFDLNAGDHVEWQRQGGAIL
jgi:hypothetical protein